MCRKYFQNSVIARTCIDCLIEEPIKNENIQDVNAIICYMPCQHGSTPFSTSDCNSGSADSAVHHSCLVRDESTAADWVFVLTDGAHPPLRCGSLHEACSAGGSLAQGLWGELPVHVLGKKIRNALLLFSLLIQRITAKKQRMSRDV